MSHVRHSRRLPIRPRRHGGRGSARRAGLTLAAAAAATGLAGSLVASPSALASRHRHAHHVPLVIYAAEGYDATVAKAFQHATGIPTSVYDAHTGIVIGKIEEERNNPRWGLVWIDGAMALAALDKQGLLAHHVEPKVRWNAHGRQFIPKDGSYIPTGYTIAATIIYNSAAVKHPPKTWGALLRSAFRGKLGILNPAIDGPAYPLVAGWAAQFGGVSDMERYISKLVANGAKLYNAPDDELNAIKQGTIDLAFAQSSYGIGVGETNPHIKMRYPRYVTPVPSVIGIDARAPKAEQAEARRFAHFVLSRAGQRAMQAGDPHGDSLYWPVLAGVSPRPKVPSPATIPVRILNPYAWGAKENTINHWFTANVAG